MTEVACVSCLVYVLRERGEWGEAVALGRDLIARGDAVWVAEGLIGAIYGAQGKLGAARRLLTSSYATAAQAGHFHMAADTTIGLARLAAAEGAGAEAAERCRALLARWERSEDRHYAVKGLRWAAAFLARSGDLAGTHACAEALTRIASETGHADALAALAHAIGETALADGDADTAAVQIGHAVELHRGLDLPWERAEIELRAGVALAAAGERELGPRASRRGLPGRAPARRAAARGRGRARGGGAWESPSSPASAVAPRARPGSRRASSRSCASWPWGGRTARSPAALPEPAHRRHARPQHPAQARLRHARRGRAPGGGARPARRQRRRQRLTEDMSA